MIARKVPSALSSSHPHNLLPSPPLSSIGPDCKICQPFDKSKTANPSVYHPTPSQPIKSSQRANPPGRQNAILRQRLLPNRASLGRSYPIPSLRLSSLAAPCWIGAVSSPFPPSTSHRRLESGLGETPEYSGLPCAASAELPGPVVVSSHISALPR